MMYVSTLITMTTLADSPSKLKSRLVQFRHLANEVNSGNTPRDIVVGLLLLNLKFTSHDLNINLLLPHIFR